MTPQTTPEDARSLFARAGLAPPEERLERLAAGIESARATGGALAALKLGLRGPAPFRPPEPARDR